MARNDPKAAPVTPEVALVHPVYLDVPMMVSFLAALQGGVAFEDETTRRLGAVGERERAAEGSARFGIPGLAQILGLDMSGRMASRDRDETSEEVRAVRQHTAASLFNALHAHMHEAGYIVRVGGAGDVQGMESGGLVEITGRFLGNPLQLLLSFFERATPYLEMEGRVDEKLRGGQPKKPQKARQGVQSGRASAATQEEQAAALVEAMEQVQKEVSMEMLRQMQTDLKEAPVHDMVIRGPEDLGVVLTMSAEFLSPETNEQLRAGDFTVLGKVTRVLQEGEEINLARRTVLDVAPEVAKEVIGGFQNAPGLQIDVGGAIVVGPALQVLPLAVFV